MAGGTSISINDVTAAVSLVSTVLPQALAAYTVLKSVWLAANPGKTEDDFIALLQAADRKNIDDAAAILIKDGYSLDADGNWVAPVPASA